MTDENDFIGIGSQKFVPDRVGFLKLYPGKAERIVLINHEHVVRRYAHFVQAIKRNIFCMKPESDLCCKTFGEPTLRYATVILKYNTLDKDGFVPDKDKLKMLDLGEVMYWVFNETKAARLLMIHKMSGLDKHDILVKLDGETTFQKLQLDADIQKASWLRAIPAALAKYAEEEAKLSGTLIRQLGRKVTPDEFYNVIRGQGAASAASPPPPPAAAPGADTADLDPVQMNNLLDNL